MIREEAEDAGAFADDGTGVPAFYKTMTQASPGSPPASSPPSQHSPRGKVLLKSKPDHVIPQFKTHTGFLS